MYNNIKIEGSECREWNIFSYEGYIAESCQTGSIW